LFYIKLTQREDGETQLVVCGIDPGSKKEAFTVRSETKTFLNIQTDAITHVKDRVADRAMMRRNRRNKNCPHRKCRLNRTVREGFVAPSTKSRYDWKLTICKMLQKLFPILKFVYEDISAITREGKRMWNLSFSPLQTGKTYFINKLKEMGEVIIKKGYDTFEKRNELGLRKVANKLSNSFYAHCVDSWVLAGFGLPSPSATINNEEIIFMRKIPFFKRQLHKFQTNHYGKRPRYGGTISFGKPRGSIIKHKDLGLGRIGGFNEGMKDIVGFHLFQSYKSSTLLSTGKLKFQPFINLKDTIFLAPCKWAWSFF
jgi:hypothetical protein